MFPPVVDFPKEFFLPLSSITKTKIHKTNPFHSITQELRLMTTFLAGIPSASWRPQAAGQTSPAWVRAPSSGAEEEMRIGGCMASRS